MLNFRLRFVMFCALLIAAVVGIWRPEAAPCVLVGALAQPLLLFFSARSYVQLAKRAAAGQISQIASADVAPSGQSTAADSQSTAADDVDVFALICANRSQPATAHSTAPQPAPAPQPATAHSTAPQPATQPDRPISLKRRIFGKNPLFSEIAHKPPKPAISQSLRMFCTFSRGAGYLLFAAIFVPTVRHFGFYPLEFFATSAIITLIFTIEAAKCLRR